MKTLLKILTLLFSLSLFGGLLSLMGAARPSLDLGGLELTAGIVSLGCLGLVLARTVRKN